MSITEQEIKDALASLEKMKVIVDKYEKEVTEKLSITEKEVTIETLNNNMKDLQKVLKKLKWK